MGYTNPARIMNKQALAIIDGGEQVQNQLLTTASEISESVKIQKEQKDKLEEANIKLENNFYDGLQQATKNHGQLDRKVAGQFEELTSSFVEVNRLAALGPPEGISKTEANLRRRELMNTPKEFAEQASYLTTEVAAYGEALSNGSMSSTGSPVNKAVLDALYNDRQVEIARDNGEFFYYIPKMDKKGNPLPWPENEGMLNGTKLAERSQLGESMFNNKADISGITGAAWKKFSGEEEGVEKFVKSDYYRRGAPHPVTGEPMMNIPEGQEQLISVPVEGSKDLFITDVESSGVFQTQLGDQKSMLSVWQDEIPDGEEVADANGVEPGQPNYIPTYPPSSLGAFAADGNALGIDLKAMGLTMEEWQNSIYGEYPTNITPEQKSLIQENQGKAAKRYMAESAWDNNALAAGTTKAKGMRKIVEPEEKLIKPGSGDKDDTKSPWNLVKNDKTRRLKFEVAEKKRSEIESKFKFLPDVMDEKAIEEVERQMGFAPGDFASEIGSSKEEFEKFALKQVGIDDEFEIIESSKIEEDVKRAKVGSTIVIKGVNYRVISKNGKKMIVKA